MENLDDPKNYDDHSLAPCVGVVVVAGLLHPATGAGTGVSLRLVPGLLLLRDTDQAIHTSNSSSQSNTRQRAAASIPLASSRCPSCCLVFTYTAGESGFLGL
ncbi:hypothetical protein EVAR_58128_1 [Eumeta japonica]|uniref:Uncharacterized protein n=1 Tax=Eumeta variegata TaxID=151549 RepID=A0A4C1YXB3_EUMVA|nr:hypothetical protein EVAR_58128_1 [Eumeta japonica]